MGAGVFVYLAFPVDPTYAVWSASRVWLFIYQYSLVTMVTTTMGNWLIFGLDWYANHAWFLHYYLYTWTGGSVINK